MIKSLVVTIASVLLITACSGTTQPPAASPTTSSVASVSPSDTEYSNAAELAAAVDKAGFPCTPMVSGTSIQCSVPSYADREPLRFTVWPTPQAADAGIKAMLNYNQTIADIGGKPLYAVVGKNWIISAGEDGNAANQVVSLFGGNLRSTV